MRDTFEDEMDAIDRRYNEAVKEINRKHKIRVSLVVCFIVGIYLAEVVRMFLGR